MKSRDDLRKIFELLDQARQNFATQEQRRQHTHEALRQQTDATRAAEAQLADKKKGDWTREQLGDYAKQVRAQIAHAKNDLDGSAPEQKLSDLRAALAQSQTREAQLQNAAEQIARLAPLAARARAVRASVRLSDEIARGEDELHVIENADPALMRAYEQLEQLQTQVAELERRRAEVAAKVRWLGEQLPNGEPRAWANLAFDDMRQLSAALGRCQRRLGDQVDQVGEQAADLKSQVAKREKKLAAAQQAVAALRAEVQAHQAQLEREPGEIRVWVEELLCYGAGDLDPSADDALLDYSKRTQAKRAALDWFGQNVAAPSRG